MCLDLLEREKSCKPLISGTPTLPPTCRLCVFFGPQGGTTVTTRMGLNGLDSEVVIREITSGQGLSLAQGARVIPPTRQNRPVHPSTLWRWATDGVKAGAGQRVFLEVA